MPAALEGIQMTGSDGFRVWSADREVRLTGSDVPFDPHEARQLILDALNATFPEFTWYAQVFDTKPELAAYVGTQPPHPDLAQMREDARI